MKAVRETFREIKKSFANISSFPFNVYPLPKKASRKSEFLHLQMDQVIRETPDRILFLIGPYGSGKTTLVRTYLEKRPEFSFTYRSFIKITNSDYALLHLTDHWSRFLFFGLILGLGAALYYWIPQLSTLPLAYLLGTLFTKSYGSSIYIFHEAFRTIFFPQHKIVVIEDLEKSILGTSSQWAFLANLWQGKRTYIVTLGYSPEDKQGPLRLIDLAIKLGGAVIQIPLDEEGNYDLLRLLDPEIPFARPNREKDESQGWMSLFTYREILMLHEQAMLRLQADPHAKSQAVHKLKYISAGLELLMEKLGLTHQGAFFLEAKREIAGIGDKPFSEDQRHFVKSFFQSIDPALGVQLAGNFSS